MKKIEIDYELEDIKNDSDAEVSIISKIKKSRNYALSILFIAKKFHNNENITIKELSNFLFRDKAYIFQILDNLENYGLIKKIKPSHLKHNVYVPVLNDNKPLIFDYIDIAKKSIGKGKNISRHK